MRIKQQSQWGRSIGAINCHLVEYNSLLPADGGIGEHVSAWSSALYGQLMEADIKRATKCIMNNFGENSILLFLFLFVNTVRKEESKTVL